VKALLALVLVVAGSLFVRPAVADEVAPALEGADLRFEATSAFQHTFHDRPAITGVYLAFDPNPTDAYAQAACDDDGDPVVVISDAMLRLIKHVIVLGTGRLERYADYLVANQAPGKRLLLPPPGAFGAGASSGPNDRERVIAVLTFVLGRELERHRARDLVCPHPTATTEAGDAIWTAAEQKAAATTALSLYPGNAVARDEAVAKKALHDGVAVEATVDLLTFFARFEAEHAKTPARVVPSYVVMHPGSATRLAHVKAIANEATP